MSSRLSECSPFFNFLFGTYLMLDACILVLSLLVFWRNNTAILAVFISIKFPAAFSLAVF
jgi:hypothetical protein